MRRAAVDVNIAFACVDVEINAATAAVGSKDCAGQLRPKRGAAYKRQEEERERCDSGRTICFNCFHFNL